MKKSPGRRERRIAERDHHRRDGKQWNVYGAIGSMGSGSGYTILPLMEQLKRLQKGKEIK